MAEQLLKIRNLKIEGRSDEVWNPIINGIDLDLKKGEVLGLIGESGAGKSSVGLATMGFTRDGCRISGGSVEFDGVDLVTASAAVKRSMLGKRIAYVAQSAAASFNPAHRLLDQHTEAPVQHRVQSRSESELDGIELYQRLRLPDQGQARPLHQCPHAPAPLKDPPIPRRRRRCRRPPPIPPRRRRCRRPPPIPLHRQHAVA